MPGTIKAEDLTAEQRKRWGIPSPGKAPKARSESGSVHVRCRRCGEEFTHTTGIHGYEHHQETTGHCAFDCVFVSD